MDITVVIINYQTPDLLKEAVTSFKNIYPKIPLLIIDNGSKDDSKTMINKLKKGYTEYLSIHFLDENIFHGPAMHFALQELVNTEFVLFLDSDTETRRQGFLEEMVAFLNANDQLYGIGHVEKVNERGFKEKDGDPILLTPYMMLKTNVYKKYPPFVHHGQPTLANFRAAREDGMSLQNYNIEDYIFHHWRGTANRYGYGLGWKGKWNHLLNKLGL